MTLPQDTASILVVDDDPIALLVTRAHLEKGGYSVECVESVALARLALSQHGRSRFKAVVSDYRMPEEDGLVLLQYLSAHDPTLAFIMATAEGEKNLVASSLRGGAVDFLDKPFSRADLLAAVQRAVMLTQSQREKASAVDEVTQLGKTQRMLLGQSTVTLGDRFKVYFRPNVQAGGDFVAAFPLSEERFAVLVSDISGHDMQAAYRSAYLQGYARATLANGSDIETTFRQLNALLMQEWNTNDEELLSLAACAVSIDMRARSLQLLNCGLPSPFLIDESGWPLLLDTARSSPLGWFKQLPEPYSLEFGEDRLVFWSDGMDDLGERLGCDPLAVAYRLLGVAEPSQELLSKATDDIIIVQLALGARLSPEVAGRVPVFHQRYSGAEHVSIDQHQQFLERSLRLAFPALGEDKLHDVLICAREALLNALQHGCGGRSDCHGTLQVCHDSGAGSLVLRVMDEGPGYEVRLPGDGEVGSCSLTPAHHGLLMIQCLSSRFSIERRGTLLTMEFSTR